MSKLFVVTTLYQEQGSRAISHNVGVFDTIEKALNALQSAFHENCDMLGIEELNKLSYFDETDDTAQATFYLCDEDDEKFMCFGYINCVKLNEYYGSTDKYEPEEGEKMEQVESLKKLIEVIETSMTENDEPVEVAILLNGGAISRKLISFADEKDKFKVFNLIDDTTQILSFEDLFDQSKTSIGKALQVGALYHVLN